MGKLYICATPIGNLEDITLRALRVLKEADVIAAEDTRHTRKLLQRYNVSTPATSYHKFNIASKTRHILDLLREGKSVAIVSDAGTPGISDPGAELIRGAVNAGVDVVPIPGPSAVMAALSASGLPTDRFCFEGFLPAKASERRKILESLKEEDRTIVLYEAPHRLAETLEDINSVFGERNITLARELTKKFEEFIRGTSTKILERLKSSRPKGEFVIIIEGKIRPKAGQAKDKLLHALVVDLLKLGISKKDVVKLVSKYSGLPKNRAYDMVLNS